MALSAGLASEILDREFLTIRAKLLEVAAALDRIDRGQGTVADDPRLHQIRRGVEVLLSPPPGRAERFQMAFSLPHDEQWRARFSASGPG